MHSVLLWALPESWTQFELLDPDVAPRLEDEMRLRFDGVIDEEELSAVLALVVENIRSAGEGGVVLLATYGQGTSETGVPPPGLSLTLALANRPPSSDPGESVSAGSSPSQAAAAFVSEATPLVLKDSEMTGFTRERRSEVSVPGVGEPLTQFQAQAFVLPKDQTGMAVVTVTTFHPDFEEDARQAARNFANTLCFVSTDDRRGQDGGL